MRRCLDRRCITQRIKREIVPLLSLYSTLSPLAIKTPKQSEAMACTIKPRKLLARLPPFNNIRWCPVKLWHDKGKVILSPIT